MLDERHDSADDDAGAQDKPLGDFAPGGSPEDHNSGDGEAGEIDVAARQDDGAVKIVETDGARSFGLAPMWAAGPKTDDDAVSGEQSRQEDSDGPVDVGDKIAGDRNREHDIREDIQLYVVAAPPPVFAVIRVVPAASSNAVKGVAKFPAEESQEDVFCFGFRECHSEDGD